MSTQNMNEISRPVIILDYDMTKTEKGRYPKKEIGTGIFHGWGFDFEEFEEGAGNFSIAIIEKPDGTVLSQPIELIKFSDVDK